MKSRGNWLTVLRRGCKLKSLTTSNVGTTAPIFYIEQGYMAVPNLKR
jgi:hypothetical protein